MRLKHHIKLVVLLMGLVSGLVSCLEEIENTYYPGTVPALTRIYGDSAFLRLETPLGMVYDEAMSSRAEGECLLASFSYNPADERNADAAARGYYYVEVGNTTPVERLETRSGRTDTTRTLVGEVAVYPTAASDFADYFVCLSQHLFMPVVYAALPGSSMRWELTYDPAQTPEMVDRQPVYALYLRAVMEEQPQDTTAVSDTTSVTPAEPVEPETYTDVFAINLNTFLSDIRANGAPVAGIYVRVRFLEGTDPNAPYGLVWGRTEPLLVD